MDPSLSSWCTRQRAAYKKKYKGDEYTHRVGAMTPERKKLLDKIEFNWNPAGNNNQHTKKRRKIVIDNNQTELTSEHMKSMLRDTSDIVQQDVPHLAAWPREDTEDEEAGIMNGICPALQKLPTERLLARPCIGDDGGLAPELLALWGRNMCKITGKPGTLLPFRMRARKEEEEEALEENIWQVKRPQFLLSMVGPYHSVSNFGEYLLSMVNSNGEYYTQEETSGAFATVNGAFAIPFSLDPNQGGDDEDDGWFVAKEDDDDADDDVGGRKKRARGNTGEKEEEGTYLRRRESPADSEPDFGGNGGGDIHFDTDDGANDGIKDNGSLDNRRSKSSNSSGGDTGTEELDMLLATLDDDEGTMPSSNWNASVEERLRRRRVSPSSTIRRRQSSGNNNRRRRGSSGTNNRRSSGSNSNNQHRQSSGPDEGWTLGLSADRLSTIYHNKATGNTTEERPGGISNMYFQIMKQNEVHRALVSVPNLPGANLIHLRNVICNEIDSNYFQFTIGCGMDFSTSQEGDNTLQDFALENFMGLSGRDGTPNKPYKVNIRMLH